MSIDHPFHRYNVKRLWRYNYRLRRSEIRMLSSWKPASELWTGIRSTQSNCCKHRRLWILPLSTFLFQLSRLASKHSIHASFTVLMWDHSEYSYFVASNHHFEWRKSLPLIKRSHGYGNNHGTAANCYSCWIVISAPHNICFNCSVCSLLWLSTVFEVFLALDLPAFSGPVSGCVFSDVSHMLKVTCTCLSPAMSQSVSLVVRYGCLCDRK